jgi:hypothetical protein
MSVKVPPKFFGAAIASVAAASRAKQGEITKRINMIFFPREVEV